LLFREEIGMEITYELLEDHQEVAEVFKQFGVGVPSEMLSKIVAARTVDGRIVGFLTLQFLLHSEPIWIDPDYREMVDWRKLLEGAQEAATGSEVYAFADSQKIEAMLEKAGYEKLPYHVWCRRL
jgi:hypothetical protein